MSKTITDWRSLSGDSTVRDISFGEGCVRFTFEDGDTGCVVCVEIATDVAVIRADEAVHPVFPKLINVADFLPVRTESGIFTAPTDFGAFMQSVREGASLVLGRRAQEWPLIFQLSGYSKHLLCPVESEASIRVMGQ